MERTLDLAKAASPEIYGRTCGSCSCDLDWIHFRKDSSSKDGYAAQCHDCESQPSLSIAEQTHLQRERNNNSEAVRRQRWADQNELKDDASRVGRQMHYSDFLLVVKKLVPCLYITEGRILGHLAVFRTFPGPQSNLDGRDFTYLFYLDQCLPEGMIPEYSSYTFDEVRDIIIRESKRGWRTVLLRLIKAGLVSEDTCNQVFGRPSEGTPSNRWYRELWNLRQRSRSAIGV